MGETPTNIVLTTQLIEDALPRLDPKRTNRGAGDPKSGGCYFTHPEDGSHCIVGQTLKELGLPLPDVDEGVNSEGVDGLEDWLSANGVDCTEQAGEMFTILQEWADGGEPWGTCVQRWKALG